MKAALISIACLMAMTVEAQERLSARQFRKKLASKPDALLLDVRTQAEIDKGYLKGAVFMDFYDSGFRKQLLNLDRSKAVFVYCAIGGRSWDAAKIMHEMGFNEVYDLKGGIIIWKIKNYDYIKLKKDSGRQGINKQELELSVRNRPVAFVDFYAPWCGPCKEMVPALDKIEKEIGDTALIVKINADENLQLMKDYGLKALPYILVFKNGSIVFRHEGYMSETDMRATIRRFYTSNQ